ncbi:MAG: hypothetical protein L3J82_01945 [Planctomycetes bacterium]|nr:hypothetical protein [Planctomycetota bacterium]
MAYIDQIEPSDANSILKRQYASAERRTGRIFNIIRVMSQTPQILADSMRLYLSVMKQDKPLPNWRCEMLAVVVSKTNSCVY